MLLPRAMTVAADIRATAEMPSRLLRERGKTVRGTGSTMKPAGRAIARPSGKQSPGLLNRFTFRTCSQNQWKAPHDE